MINLSQTSYHTLNDSHYTRYFYYVFNLHRLLSCFKLVKSFLIDQKLGTEECIEILRHILYNCGSQTSHTVSYYCSKLHVVICCDNWDTNAMPELPLTGI